MTPEEYAQRLREIDALQAKLQAMLARPMPPLPPPPVVRRDRQTLVEIALLCKQGLDTPLGAAQHQQVLLAIARLCKQALEREE